jgi:two-component system cell cycle response regulator CpdR
MIRILLAEGDASMRAHLARLLDRSGYGVSAVESGAHALDILRAETFDLLLAEMVMPGCDGIELAQRAAALNPDLRVIFITGFAAVTLENRAAPDESRILSKPFHLRELVTQVDRMFQIGSAADL